MNINRLLSLLGIARRAGKLSWGRDAVEESLADDDDDSFELHI